uniref:Uncharacterized protein n=1 Tax=Manihot esculenta TaxID=3983 RepID=A0A199UBI9_MANES
MADSLPLSMAESVLGKLGSLALEEFFLAWGLETDLEKIKRNLKVIEAVLLDAEQQLSLNPRIKIWLDNLKQVLYDAEDVVDEFECEALRSKVVKSGKTTRKVCRFFSSSNPLAFRFRMGHKLKQIRERVDEIAALKSKFGLTERIFDRPVFHREREMTHSFVDASDVIGRDQARDNMDEIKKKEYEVNQNSNLTTIGGEIVRKCKGVPLAVLTLGSLLYSVTDEREWEFIRDSEIWELKCFAYCSIFPKDYVLDDIELVYLWMANGLVQSSNENQELEDVGFRYFQELCYRCFFQDFSEYSGHVKCKMHDLIHDLALSITQNECSMFLDSTQQIAKSVRHVSFPHPESLPKDVPKSLRNLECMRTICFINERREGISSEMFIKTCCSRFQYLRVLDLSYSSFEELPASIGNLKHLKYLSLWINFNIKRLPNSIYIRCMINLRYLWITTHQMYFPTGGIGCLKSLRSLFVTGCSNLKYLFEDVQGLKKLRRLVISDCERLISLPQSIKCLKTLDTLCIDDYAKLDLRMEEGEEKQFSLQRLELRWLPKIVDFPEWLIRGSTNSLKVLKVEECNNLRELPNCLQNMASHPEVQIIRCLEAKQ